jgi:hypothetical protein
MKAPTLAQDGIKRAWRLACARERLNPNDPGKLPLIFGIDGLFDGFNCGSDCGGGCGGD